MKKFLSMVCVLVLALSMISAASAETNVFGWEVPAETVKVNVFVSTDNFTKSEEQEIGIASMQKLLKDDFNVEYTFATTDGEASEALNLALAANNYQDVILGTDDAMRAKFVEQGRAVDLAPYIEAGLMPNFVKKAGANLGMYYDEEGHLYALPRSFGNLMDLPDWSAHIRYDEYLEIGSPEIKTPQDYMDALMAVYNLHPTTEEGDKRYSLSFYDQGIPEYIGGYWGLQQGWKIDENNNLTYWTHTDEGKEMAKFFNTWWRTGTMDPDSFVNEWNDLRTKISQERIVGMIGGWWIGYNAGHEIWNQTDPDWTENKRFIQVGFKSENAENAYITNKNNLGSVWTIITDKCENVEGVVKFIDFLLSDPGAALAGWGIPGEHAKLKDATQTIATWHINSPTDWYVDPECKQAQITETWDYASEGILGADKGVFQLVQCQDRWEDGEHCIWMNQMWYSENKWKNIMFTNMAGTIFDATALMSMPAMSADVNMAMVAVEDAWKQYYPLAVMAGSDEEFEAAWIALQDAVEMADLELYTQFRTESYQANLTKMAK